LLNDWRRGWGGGREFFLALPLREATILKEGMAIIAKIA
jgi:hypothetical protein